MMQSISPFKVSQACRNKFCENIIDTSAPTIDFYILVVLSTLIVALGILADNVILVIGGMLVTPLLSPIMAIALGIVINEHQVILRSIRIFFSSTIAAVAVASIIGFLTSTNLETISLIKIMQPSLLTILVAIVAGLAASYTWVKPELNVNFAGIAITVTVIPPLTAVGLALANGEWEILRNTLNVFFLNIGGIILASLVVFSLMDFYKSRNKIITAVKEEKKEIEKKKKEVKKEKLDIEKEKMEEEKKKIKAEKEKIEKEKEKINI